MPRSRNLKPGFFKNETLCELEPLCRLLFAGLWTIADRSGRLEDRPRRIKAELLPYDDCDCDHMLMVLALRGFIMRYEVEDKRLIQIINFSKHQNPHVREPESSLPAPVEHSSEHQPSTSTARLIPDSFNLIPDSSPLIPDHGEPASPEQGGLSTGGGSKKQPPARASRSGTRLNENWVLPKQWGEWALAERPKWSEDDVRTVATMFRNYWVAKTGKDATKRDWKATWQNWVLKEHEVRRMNGSARSPPMSVAENNRAVGERWLAKHGAIDGESRRVSDD